MKAVMFAAGKSTRTYPLTVNKPKPLLKLLGSTIIKHNLDQIKEVIDEIIIVVGFNQEMIKEHLSNYEGIKISYVEQKEQLGTGHALLQVRDQLKDEEKILVMGGDDIFSKSDIESCTKSQSAILASKVKNPENYGVLEVKENKLIKIHEKQEQPISDLVNCGLYVLPGKIFSILESIPKSERGEIELTDAVESLSQQEPVEVIEVKDIWYPITFPWNLLEANIIMLKRLKDLGFQSKGKIEENVTINGDVYMEEGAVIKSHSYIQGPIYIGKDSEVGPFAHIRPETIIGDNCRIGKMELYDILIMDNTTSKHTSYAAHSIIGENVNIGAGLITADYRHDGKNNWTIIKGQKVDSGRRKLGAFIGDNVNTGIGTLIYPGRKLWPNTSTLPNEIVNKDKEE